MEESSIRQDHLKDSILTKVDELIDCVQRLGKMDLFQITVKHVNGELITKTDFINVRK